MESTSPHTITLVSAEEIEITVPYIVIKDSELVNRSIQADGFDTPIHVNFSEKAIHAMIQFMEHYSTNPPPEVKRSFRENSLAGYCTWAGLTDVWLAKYLDMDFDFISEMILLAEYMEYQVLHDFLCASFAFKFLKGKSTNEINNEFGIENDFTDDEKKKLESFFIWTKLLY